MVELSKLLVPRVVLAIIGLLAAVLLMLTDTISSEVGVLLMVGILASFGVYQKSGVGGN